jgi:hypothetical protein
LTEVADGHTLAFAMRSTRAKWFFAALAVLTNLGGGPMAWAHLAPAAHSREAAEPAIQMPACHEQAQPGAAEPAHPMPCCDGGACECATPPASLAVAIDATADLRHDALSAPPIARLIAPDPLDDTLRPPIR